MKYLLPLTILIVGCRTAPQPSQPQRSTQMEIIRKRLEILHDRVQLANELSDSTVAALQLMKDCSNIGDPLWTKRKCQQRKEAFLAHLKELQDKNDALTGRDQQLDEEEKK